jgi:Undecaprenyl-phosphate galactose phosphotransferase WbaP
MSTALPTIAVETKNRAIDPSAWMALIRSLVDFCTVSLAVTTAFAVGARLSPAASPYHPCMFLAVGLSCATFLFYGLYPGIGLTAVALIRRLVHAITLVHVLLVASVCQVPEWWASTRWALLLSWTLSLVFVPVGRLIASHFLSQRSWWGIPVLVLGTGPTAQTLIRNLGANRALGYRPVACLGDDANGLEECQGIPMVGGLEAAAYCASVYRIRCAVVAMPGLPRTELLAGLERWSKVFPTIVLIPDLLGMASLWVEARDMGGVLGLELRQNLLIPLNRWLKRGADIVISLVAVGAAAPVIALAALWIKRISPGAAFYWQEREGKDGAPIRVFKLRTMYADAERMLESHLARDPEARREWQRSCKLKNDPRVLPVAGNFLRRTSIDELPQLWNILRGDMSLVGPRPFPRYHNQRFPAEFQKLRTHVTPGLTGLWQISGRADGDLQTQTAMDSYYIRNWSPWLDLYILVRTVQTVLSRQGAY